MRLNVPSHDNKGGLDKQSFVSPSPETIRCQRAGKCLGCQVCQSFGSLPLRRTSRGAAVAPDLVQESSAHSTPRSRNHLVPSELSANHAKYSFLDRHRPGLRIPMMVGCEPLARRRCTFRRRAEVV